jgi:hypothetical protein
MAVTRMSRCSLLTYEKYRSMALGAFSADYLVVAGGGGGASAGTSDAYGGGGAGGYRTTFGTSGDNSSAESPIGLSPGQSFTVTVGAGGAVNTNGNDSVCVVTSVGGGLGGKNTPAIGGSGGGGGANNVGAAGTVNQGSAGGTGSSGAGFAGEGGGGGGASQAGGNGSNSVTGYGGDGLVSTILSDTNATSLGVGEVIGSDVYYGGGASGGRGSSSGASNGPGGDGGGGVGGVSVSTPGDPNTGGGGGGAATGSPGGSGVVILRYPAEKTINVGAGLTASTVVEGDFNVTVFTAGTGTVTVA